ncbi:DeoR/GlpR family DNA-binding transcription regulator [Gluconobacter morbifer]|nr:DeoR/GlpR family DNA-binding transcription regulator [Gluconobacter morbifer]
MQDFSVQITPRQEQIVRLVRRQGYISNEELAQHFGVVVQTIRRDVGYLSDNTLLCRCHGGAMPISTVENIAYHDRQVLNPGSKDAIGRYGARLIPDRSSLFINIGTTTEAFARNLTGHRDLRIVTNNLQVASLVARRLDFRTVIVGGELRPQDGGILGASATEALAGFRMEYGVIGISGIDEDGTLLDFDLAEIQCARTIIRNSRRVLLLADHTKFARRPTGKVGDLSEIDDLITDRPLPEAFQERLEIAGVTLHIAETT